ncbi:uncharacterized protein YehS (DUF1456 family) [Planomicrobium soli]|uniref:Uncharacterized protein YehS (DUF1456 family) n=1 Tax=Planomicrobium soli TaxID=1176648 RepID=A0A2P8H646_9BACL|nr:DUF1456 family protein [Planomicrobium soli]PSL41664.1 uncharacterized protein YehS (DUF1456 family) [Planomicrobium soli]
MDNNDLLIRLRYALDIKNNDMVEIFKLGGIDLSKEEVLKVLTKSPESDDEADGIWDEPVNEDHIKADNAMFESFLNGLIIFKRGWQEPKPGQPATPPLTNEPSKNLLLKKVKIALQLTGEDMLEILQLAGVTVTKSEMSAMLRKQGHKNYSICGDRYARNFLKGLAIKYRK